MSSSVVWQHFKLHKDDPKFAICKHCSKKMPRGAAKSTSPLLKHLKTIHPLLKLNQTSPSAERPQTTTQGLLQFANNPPQSEDDPDDPGFDDRASIISTSLAQYSQTKSRSIDEQGHREPAASCSSAHLEPVRPSLTLAESSPYESPPDQNISIDIPSPSSLGLDESSSEFQTPSPFCQSWSPALIPKKSSSQPTLSAFVDAKTKFKPGDQRASNKLNCSNDLH